MISNKKEWYKLFNSGCFNRTKTMSVAEFMVESLFTIGIYKGKLSDSKMYMLRNTTEPGGFNLVGSESEIFTHIHHANKMEYYIKNFIIAEIAPDEHIVVQGHYDGTIAEVTFEKKVMKHCQLDKIISRCVLLNLIGYENYSILNEWLDIYPGHIIEFSFYDKPIGTLKEQLIIWEIRNY